MIIWLLKKFFKRKQVVVFMNSGRSSLHMKKYNFFVGDFLNKQG